MRGTQVTAGDEPEDGPPPSGSRGGRPAGPRPSRRSRWRPPRRRRGHRRPITWSRRLAAGLVAHRVFLAALAAAAALRGAVLLGFPPVMWFNDSYGYVAAAVSPHPGAVRPSGYGLALRALLPFHSFALVAVLQHLAGLVVAALCYGLPRRWGLPGWAATLVAAPVLFDAYQLQLEQTVMSDTLFVLLVVVAAGLVCRRKDPGAVACAAAAALLGLAAVTRTVGLPLLVLLLGHLALRRAGRRALGAALVAGLLPVGGYASWFHAAYGRYGLTAADGIFLYGRTMAFADCARMRPPPRLASLCAAVPPAARPPSQMYIWDPRAPLNRRFPRPFSAEANRAAGAFAERAIRSQPMDYLAVVARDTWRTFRWDRPVFPDRATYAQYEFDRVVEPPPGWARGHLDRYDRRWARTRVVDPYAAFLHAYQRHVFLRGPFFAALLLVGAVGATGTVVACRRPALLPWVMSVTLVITPAATAEFGYRYALAAVPLACLAAGLALADPRPRKTGPPPGEIEYRQVTGSRNVLSVAEERTRARDARGEHRDE